jgi:hypothetical protein
MEAAVRRRARVLGILGALLTGSVLLGAGEAFLRCFPPRDFRPYLGAGTEGIGSFRADRRFGIQYRSWYDFQSEYRERLTQYEPLARDVKGRPTWALFGNSFVQAPGMLGDTAASALPARRVFFLARNEDLHVRLAQIELLLEHGLKPERLFVVLLPHDVSYLAIHSLGQIRVSPAGAVTWSPRLPAGRAGDLLKKSRLGLLGWVQAGQHEAVPGFRPSTLSSGIHPAILADVRHLFGALATVCRRHGVPATVVLIPNYEQICRGAPSGFQQTMTALCHRLGFDVCDVREAFVSQPDKAGLFIPDKHFSARGNRLLLETILAHVQGGQTAQPGLVHGGPHP